MAIKEIVPPAESTEKFNDWLNRGKQENERSLQEDPYGRSLAIKVFHISLSEIMSENGFENANPVSWRHIHTDSKGPCAIEIQLADEEKDHQFQEVDRGNMAEEYKTLLGAWDKIEELEKEDYEIAYLRIFALKIGALWLRADERKNDYFIPLPPHFHGLVSGKMYRAEQFLEITRQAVHTLMSGGDTNTRDIFGGDAYTNDPFIGG